MAFSRTPSGLAAEHLFSQQVVVYIEGHTDKAFYEEILKGYDCQVIEKTGKEECKKLAIELEQKNLPFVVILDGHYEILERTRSRHRRIILLHRHSFENYLFEEKPIEQFCRDRSHPNNNTGKLASRFRTVVQNTEVKFKKLIVLDVAHQRSKTGYKVLPDKPNRFFNTQRKINFIDSQIQKRCKEADNCIDKQSFNSAKALVDKFLKKHRFMDLLPGHYAFGIIRLLIINIVNSNILEDEIRPYLSRMVWSLVKTPDHDSLKRRLRRAVLEAQKIPRSGKGVA